MSIDYDSVIQSAKNIVGSENVLTAKSDCWAYGYDNSRRHAPPDLVVFAEHRDAIQQLVSLCNTHQLPLITRGRGTGTTGATVPHTGGMVLSLERMNHIINVDPANRAITVQPGVTNQQVQQESAKHGFFWPPCRGYPSFIGH